MTGSFVRWSGLALCVAAVATLALNIFVSPFLPAGSEAPFAINAASSVYFLRQCIASLIALLLVFGIVGIQIERLGRGGLLGSLAFVIALSGQVALFAIEYGQAFQVHDYALYAPDMLSAAMKDPHRPLLIGAMIAIGGFLVGWLLLATSLFLSRDYSRIGAAAIFLGILSFFATGKLGGAGGIVTSAITGAGWFLIGLQMIRQRGVT